MQVVRTCKLDCPVMLSGAKSITTGVWSSTLQQNEVGESFHCSRTGSYADVLPTTERLHVQTADTYPTISRAPRQADSIGHFARHWTLIRTIADEACTGVSSGRTSRKAKVDSTRLAGFMSYRSQVM